MNFKPVNASDFLPEVRTPEDLKMLDEILTLDVLKILKSTLTIEQKNKVITNDSGRVTIGEILDEVINRSL